MTQGRLASQDVVLAEVKAAREMQLQHFDALDAKAGIVLGFAGALVALAPTQGSALVAAGRLGAVVAASWALSAYWPRSYKTTDLRQLRDLYLTADPIFTARKLLDTLVSMTVTNAKALDEKASRLKWAMSFLLAAALLVALGLVVP